MSNEMSNEYISPQEYEDIKKLRDLFAGKLPSDLDTDLNLRRWVEGWKGQMHEIEPRLKAYIKNRKAAKLDVPNFTQTYESHPHYVEYFKYFSFIPPSRTTSNSRDNTVLQVERLENINYHRVSELMTCGDVCLLTFVFMEAMFRQILAQEKATGKPSGISVIYDMQNFPLLDYANPNCPHLRNTKHSLVIIQDYYCNILHNIYVVNAPKFLSVVLDIVKVFLAPTTQKKIVVLGSNYKSELRKLVDPEVLPVKYGGDKTSDMPDVDSYALTSFPTSVTDEIVEEALRDDNEYLTEYIKANKSLDIRYSIENPNSILSWSFWVNSDVEFGLYKENTYKERIPVMFRYSCYTSRLPERGKILCKEPGEYIFEFANVGTRWFRLRLDYCIESNENK